MTGSTLLFQLLAGPGALSGDGDPAASLRVRLAITGGTATDWLPEWEPLPHLIDLGR